MPNAKADGEWIRCATCGHKLGRIVGEWGERNVLPAVEIKCHSCKTMNYIPTGKSDDKEEHT